MVPGVTKNEIDYKTFSGGMPDSSTLSTKQNCIIIIMDICKAQHGLRPSSIKHTTHTTVLQLFFCDLVPSCRVNQCQKKSFSGLYGAMGDIRDRHTDNPGGCHSNRTSQRPTSLISPIFTPYAFPAATFPIYPGLG